MIIINANILTMEDEVYKNGYIKIHEGKIEQVDNMEEIDQAFLQSEEIIDVQGAVVLPGFVDAHSHLGMFEDGLGFEGDDGNEDTDPVTPHLRAIDGVNAMDHCFTEALKAGVTTVATGPGSANPISGIWTSMKTYGRRIDDMIVKDAIGMKFALGENPKDTYNSKNQAPVTRMAVAALIREQLEKSKRYLEDCEKAKEDEDYDEPEYDAKCEALIPVLKRKMKAFFHAHRADDIFTAIRIANEYKLDYVIIHGTDGHLIADILSKEKARIITGPIISDRSKPELRGHTSKNPAVLAEHGIQIAICTDHPETPIQYLLLSGSVCVQQGLSYQKMLKTITIDAARLCGIDDRVGSIKKGKDADLLVFKNQEIDGGAVPDMVIIDGVQVV